MDLDEKVAWMSAGPGQPWPEPLAGGQPDFLSPAEASRLVEMRFPRRRAEWLLGRWTAKRLLLASGVLPGPLHPREIEVANEPEGAPYYRLKGGQRLPVSLSISHRAGMAACALGRGPGLGVGIDLECVEPRSDAFVQDYFTAMEVEQVRCAGENRNLITALLWSAKEAALKVLGVGLRVDTRRVEVTVEDTAREQEGWIPLAIHAPSLAAAQWTAGWRRIGEMVAVLAVIQKSPEG